MVTFQHNICATLWGFATNLTAPAYVSVGTTEEGSDIMESTLIPAGEHTQIFMAPITNLIETRTVYLSGIGESDTWIAITSNNAS